MTLTHGTLSLSTKCSKQSVWREAVCVKALSLEGQWTVKANCQRGKSVPSRLGWQHSTTAWLITNRNKELSHFNQENKLSAVAGVRIRWEEGKTPPTRFSVLFCRESNPSKMQRLCFNHKYCSIFVFLLSVAFWSTRCSKELRGEVVH